MPQQIGAAILQAKAGGQARLAGMISAAEESHQSKYPCMPNSTDAERRISWQQERPARADHQQHHGLVRSPRDMVVKLRDVYDSRQNPVAIDAASPYITRQQSHGSVAVHQSESVITTSGGSFSNRHERKRQTRVATPC
mmetsp:Transcript_64116/g.111833  ORF Transcript_64116/g.111833 Transcript_64116/m.111833 type:complete len:139 (+) Transcript_64116:1426-1842(+)